MIRSRSLLITSLLLYFIASPLAAQLPPVNSDPFGKSSANAQACSATEASCAEAAAKIIPQVMGPSPMEENLRRLTDEIGGRVSGSPEMAKAVEWGVAAFRAEGIEVHTEKYTLATSWSEGDSRLELLGPQKFPVRLVAEGWSPATPAGGIEANLIDVGFGTTDDFAKAGASIKGSILLVSSEIGSTWNDLFNEYALPPAIIDRAVKGGAAAILWMGARERLLLYRHTNSGRRSDRRDSAGGSCARRRHAPGAHHRGLPGQGSRALFHAEQDRRAHRTVQRHRRNSRPRKARRSGDSRRASRFLGPGHRRAGQRLQRRDGDRSGSRHPGDGARPAAHYPLRALQRRRTGHGRILAVCGRASRGDGQDSRRHHFRFWRWARQRVFTQREAGYSRRSCRKYSGR